VIDSDTAIRYRAIFDAAHDAIFLMQGDRFIDCNPMTLQVFGCTRDQILGHPPYRFSPPEQPDGRDSRDAALEWIQAALDHGPQRFEWLHIRFDGTPFFAEVSLNRVDLSGDVFLQAIVRDVTPRKVAEDEIRRSEARYRELFEKASDGIVVCSASLQILDANPSFGFMTGYSIDELRGMRIVDLYLDVPPGDIQASLQTVLDGNVSGRYRRLARRDGSATEVEGRSKMLGDGTFLELYRDVSEARRQEEERQRLGRIETMGIIAGGIAHDFNNILTAALGYVELGRQHGEGIAQVVSDLDNAVAAIERARKLTQQLLVFARGGEPVRRVLSLGDLIRESAEFSLRGSNVVCRFDVPDDLWLVDADEAQIGQVFHNIVLNAQQAMPSGGEVFIRGRNIEAGADDVAELGSGPFVSVVVTDQGGGIPEEQLARIFDPYYTTKADGRGLGLPTAYRIVQRHGGRLSVEVDPGVGCLFTVVLPASPGAVHESRADPGIRRHGSERILVMDDDADILGLLRNVLGRAGYDVYCASDGGEALGLCRMEADVGRAFDLAILDLTVRGGMGGIEVLPLLRGVMPGLRVVVSSGYSEDPVMASFQEKGFDGACAKPYRIDVLLAEVERVLDLPPRE
jgi:PAS domain S-box-containing protein